MSPWTPSPSHVPGFQNWHSLGSFLAAHLGYLCIPRRMWRFHLAIIHRVCVFPPSVLCVLSTSRYQSGSALITEPTGATAPSKECCSAGSLRDSLATAGAEAQGACPSLALMKPLPSASSRACNPESFGEQNQPNSGSVALAPSLPAGSCQEAAGKRSDYQTPSLAQAFPSTEPTSSHLFVA